MEETKVTHAGHGGPILSIEEVGNPEPIYKADWTKIRPAPSQMEAPADGRTTEVKLSRGK